MHTQKSSPNPVKQNPEMHQHSSDWSAAIDLLYIYIHWLHTYICMHIFIYCIYTCPHISLLNKRNKKRHTKKIPLWGHGLSPEGLLIGTKVFWSLLGAEWLTLHAQRQSTLQRHAATELWTVFWRLIFVYLTYDVFLASIIRWFNVWRLCWRLLYVLLVCICGNYFRTNLLFTYL